MPKVCAVIRSNLKDAKNAINAADLIEIRADCIKGLDRLRTNKKKILTVRKEADGGKWRGNEKEREALIARLLPSFDFVDIELGSKTMKSVLGLSKKLGKRTILSYHNIRRTPSLLELKKVFKAASKHGMPKIATRINAFADILILMELVNFSRGRCIVVGMGTLGKITRVLFPLMGCPWTYGTLEKSELITIKELRGYWNAF
ncbi:MAG: type I 3-dehydroquinate dehydratase [Candidatus Aenigmarchaeota archaeon]|nr:type I 3-dehydroquinate dehydratase [Candidatus Aenigmarchaeota archaeon]